LAIIKTEYETLSTKEKTKQTRESPVIVWILTIMWLFVWTMFPFIIYIINGASFSFKDIDFNEVGDYLAGVAAPVAFFWLVYGYYQQGKELKLNNKTLSLQYEELRHSVSAQQDQAASMKEQLSIVVREKFYPKFKIKKFNYLKDEAYIGIVIENVSNEVYSTNIEVLSDGMILANTIDSNVKYIDFEIQTIDDIQKQFKILLKIDFILEIGHSVEEFYEINYSTLKHNVFNEPILEKSKQEVIG